MLSDFIQRFSLNLPDSFSGNRENFSDFFQSVSYAVSQTETHIQYLLLSDGQIGDNFIDVSAAECGQRLTCCLNHMPAEFLIAQCQTR